MLPHNPVTFAPLPQGRCTQHFTVAQQLVSVVPQLVSVALAPQLVSVALAPQLVSVVHGFTSHCCNFSPAELVVQGLVSDWSLYCNITALCCF